MKEILEVIIETVYEKTENKGGKCIICGKLNLTLLGKGEENEEGECELLSESCEVPFKYNCDLPAPQGEIISRCDLSAGEVNVRLEGERIVCKGEIYVAYELIEKRCVQVLKRAILLKDREIKKEPACVRVYFPKEKDTLWDVAKKYHVTASRLRESNDLLGDSLSGVKSIIV